MSKKIINSLFMTLCICVHSMMQDSVKEITSHGTENSVKETASPGTVVNVNMQLKTDGFTFPSKEDILDTLRSAKNHSGGSLYGIGASFANMTEDRLKYEYGAVTLGMEILPGKTVIKIIDCNTKGISAVHHPVSKEQFDAIMSKPYNQWLFEQTFKFKHTDSDINFRE